MPLVLLARHGQTTYNVARRVNGDPSVPVGLTELGVEQARTLGRQLAAFPVDLVVHSRFPRTRRTAEIALAGREAPYVEERLLDDLDVGALEGAELEVYRRFTEEHGHDAAYPGGESRREAARRYAEAFRVVAARREEHILVVTHELAVRFAVNAFAEAPGLDEPRLAIPNATPFLFPAARLAEAAERIDELAR